jgi:hypothetical protein
MIPQQQQRRYKGVYKSGGKYKAQLQHCGNQYYLGSYDSALEAAHAYDAKWRELFSSDPTNLRSVPNFDEVSPSGGLILIYISPIYDYVVLTDRQGTNTHHCSCLTSISLTCREATSFHPALLHIQLLGARSLLLAAVRHHPRNLLTTIGKWCYHHSTLSLGTAARPLTSVQFTATLLLQQPKLAMHSPIVYILSAHLVLHLVATVTHQVQALPRVLVQAPRFPMGWGRCSPPLTRVRRRCGTG